MDQLKGTIVAQNPDSIQNMFGVISPSYDRANAFISFGLHTVWKKKLVRKLQLKPNDRVLDCATGTGDLAFLFEKQMKRKGATTVAVTGTDFCEPMLKIARERAAAQGSSCKFEWADVTSLVYPAHTFDKASISFGIRNVQDPVKGLKELARVVRPGGRVAILEMGQPTSAWLKPGYQFYARKILPRIGGWVSGQPKAYQYLQTSSAQFPSGEAFLNLAPPGLFSKKKAIPLLGGIAYLYLLDLPEKASGAAKTARTV